MRRAISRGPARDLLGEHLRRRDDDRLGAREHLAERDRDVAGAGRHVDDEQVELAPVDVLQELLERAVEHRPAPHQRLVVVDEEADRHQLQVVRDRRDHQLVDEHRLLVDPEHLRDRVAVDVGVEDADPRAPCAANAAARLTVSVDLPTPPLPEATAITRVVGSSWIALSDSGRPPRSFEVSAARSSGLMTSNSSRTAVDALDGADLTRDLLLERVPERAAGDGERDRDRDVAAGDRDLADHVELGDRLAQLGIDHVRAARRKQRPWTVPSARSVPRRRSATPAPRLPAAQMRERASRSSGIVPSCGPVDRVDREPALADEQLRGGEVDAARGLQARRPRRCGRRRDGRT